MEVGKSLVINSFPLSPLRIAQWGVVVKCSRKLSRARKQHIFFFSTFSVLVYIYRVRKKSCYKNWMSSFNSEFKHFFVVVQTFLLLSIKGKYKEVKQMINTN